MNEHSPDDRLHEQLGVELTETSYGQARTHLSVEARHLAPTSRVHSGTLVTLADAACGYGCLASLPDGQDTFATIDLTIHLVGASRPGEELEATANLRHAGRTIQLWDATVTAGSDPLRVIAHFRCTQLLMARRS